MEATRAAGAIGIPGLYVTEDPGAKDSAARSGNLTMRLGLGWAKSHSFTTGQTPVMKYNRSLMMAILHDRIKIAKAVNVELISLGQAPEAYQAFDSGIPKKFVIDPHHIVQAEARPPRADPDEHRANGETLAGVFSCSRLCGEFSRLISCR